MRRLWHNDMTNQEDNGELENYSVKTYSDKYLEKTFIVGIV